MNKINRWIVCFTLEFHRIKSNWIDLIVYLSIFETHTQMPIVHRISGGCHALHTLHIRLTYVTTTIKAFEMSQSWLEWNATDWTSAGLFNSFSNNCWEQNIVLIRIRIRVEGFRQNICTKSNSTNACCVFECSVITLRLSYGYCSHRLLLIITWCLIMRLCCWRLVDRLSSIRLHRPEWRVNKRNY